MIFPQILAYFCETLVFLTLQAQKKKGQEPLGE